MGEEFPLGLGNGAAVSALRLADLPSAQLQRHQRLIRCVSTPEKQDMARTGGNKINVVAYTVAEVDPLVRQFSGFCGHRNAVALGTELQILDLCRLLSEILALFSEPGQIDFQGDDIMGGLEMLRVLLIMLTDSSRSSRISLVSRKSIHS